MNNREYFRRYAYYYLYAIAIVLILTLGFDRAATAVWKDSHAAPVIVIDPGHGGMDSGATSCTGQKESDINLQISLRLRDFLTFLGYDTAMTRTEDVSLGTDASSIRAGKVSDLKNRVAFINGQPDALVLSIHQNHFPQSQYSGPQVFFSGDAKSFAELMQSRLNQSAGGTRACKISDGVYLMEHIQFPGILIECGFLSNPKEEALLRSPEYQKKLAAIIAAATAEYLKSPAAA